MEGGISEEEECDFGTAKGGGEVGFGGGEVGGRREKLAESMAMALWNRERSSSSSGREIEIWRGGSIRGATKKNKTGKERMRIRAGISGEEEMEITAMAALLSTFFLVN
ncbi:hypothetical protein Salat_0390200 [Sesamum alatum]|uniref:Uncharacterized protein n=1 Tax=Sesamum alatum TaxID=300844 RepID=A0AAE2CZU0_9LAMI|nr:hypothetical protein Salat_0390200 [Sesamum alatum]